MRQRRSRHPVPLWWLSPKVFARASGIIAMVASLQFGAAAHAERLSLRSYGDADGLSNLDVTCLHQSPSGFLFACTTHGVFVYDGRRFTNLGTAQGLPDGGNVDDIVFIAGGRIVVRYGAETFVSRASLGNGRSPSGLRFMPAVGLRSAGDARAKEIAAWRDGAVLIAGGKLEFLDAGDPARPRTTPLALTPAEAAALRNPIILRRAGDRLWLSFRDGRVCSYDESGYSCYGAGQGLSSGSWNAFLAARDGTVLARSESAIATIDPRSHRVTVEQLPYQDTSFANGLRQLDLQTLPSGAILTQSAGGFIVRHKSGWQRWTAADGLPAARIQLAMSDQQGNLWLAAQGRGIFRIIGYGEWENLDHRDGLSEDLVWQVVREPGGPLWTATDLGIDAISTAGETTRTRAAYPGPTFSVTIGASGHLWRSDGTSGISCVDLGTGDIESFATPPPDQLARGNDDRIWLATEAGLFYVDDVADAPRRVQPISGITQHVSALVPDRDGSVWFLTPTALKHWRPDGSVVTVVSKWLQPDFEPSALALGAAGEVWVGGPGGGLYRVSLAGDQVLGLQNVEPPNILSSTVVSVMVDRRGWVWAGTDRGVSVFNRQRWVSVTTDNGLVWNDTDTLGLYEDTDGSVWISTSQGLSHLLRPETLFRLDLVKAVISSLALGDRLFPTRAIAYTTDPLEVQFGTLDYRAERSIIFRYRLDGVDTDWASTSSATARYPFVPAGHHSFTVVAVDPLTGQSSQPASFTIRIEKPWWASWPLRTAYGLAGALLMVSIWQAKNRHLLHRQHVLEKTVELRTEQIRIAQEALILQATRDGLTGLLNRAEIQKRFADMLRASNDAERLVVGLVDIDHFKRINDTHGHLAGDEILQGISERIREILRPGESAGRYGGEEVLILLTDWDGMAAARILDLNEAIRAVPFHADGREISITCSIGIGWAEADDDWKSLIGRIDQALYKAKHAGRDQVMEAETSLRLNRG